ncbi:MAG TPA: SRPBCC family protein [Candidatus Sulfopaludibacter sp.]|nr:SRPBCC family protein [Candidatus Sulfopaludibacter sp.]
MYSIIIMTVILAKREINSPIDKIWNIISNVDKDPEYWHGTRSIKNIKKEGNTIEREVIISFKNYKCKEIVSLYNKNKITIEMVEGPLIGRKTITLEKLDENITRINVVWDIHMKGLLNIFTIFVKKHILKGTVDAIARIAKNVED